MRHLQHLELVVIGRNRIFTASIFLLPCTQDSLQSFQLFNFFFVFPAIMRVRDSAQESSSSLFWKPVPSAATKRKKKDEQDFK